MLFKEYALHWSTYLIFFSLQQKFREIRIYKQLVPVRVLPRSIVLLFPLLYSNQNNPESSNEHHPGGNNVDNDLLNDIKSESGVSEEDLGFLQSMNLSSLVREFEMEAAISGQGSQHLGILSLANDDEVVGPEHPFSGNYQQKILWGLCPLRLYTQINLHLICVNWA